MRPCPLTYEKLAAELKQVRENGYSYSCSEMLEGAEGYSAPIFDKPGRVIAALSVAGPEHQIRKTDTAQLVKLLKATCQKIMDNHDFPFRV